MSLDDNVFLNSIKRVPKIRDDKRIKGDTGKGGLNLFHNQGESYERMARSTYSKVINKSGLGSNARSSIFHHPTKTDVLDDDQVCARLTALVNFLEPHTGTKEKMTPMPLLRHSHPYVQYRSDKCFLMVEVKRIKNLLCPDSIGIANSFVEIDWNSQTQKTTINEDSMQPIFNQSLMFKLGTFNKLREKHLINIAKPKELNKNDVAEFAKINKAYLKEMEEL